MAPPIPPPARKSRFTIGVALIALLASLLSAALSLYAIGVANGAKNTSASATGSVANKAGNGDPQPPASHAAGTTPTVEASAAAPKPAASPGELNPKANFTAAYTPETQTLVIHKPNSGYNYVDLDKPAVGADSSVAEFYYSSYNDTFSFQDDVKAATSTTADLGPGDCVDLIQHSALPDDSRIPVHTQDLTMCLVSSFAHAQREGISWKVALVHVTSVAQDGTAQVTVKAWNIPTD